MPSNEELLAAAERIEIHYMPEKSDRDIAANACRLLSTAGEGFEAYYATNPHVVVATGDTETDVTKRAFKMYWQAATAAANAKREAEIDELEKDKCVIAAKYEDAEQRIATLEADLTALADEVERRDTYWNREKHQYEDPMLTCPARVRELLAARKKEEG